MTARACLLAGAAAMVFAGCHTYSRVESTSSGESRLRKRDGAVRTLEPTITVTERGRLAFVSPLVCSYDLLVEQTTHEISQSKPNMATFIVGLIAAAAGGVSLIIGLSDDDPGAAPATYLGGLGVVAGAPLLVGPFVGHSTSRRRISRADVIQGEKDQPCGQQPLNATEALVRMGPRQIFGSVRDGAFSESPFNFIDAFALHKVSGVELGAELYDGAGSRRSLQTTLDATTLARGRDGFFRGIGVDGSIGKLRKVPNIVATNIELARALVDGEPSVTVTVAVTNRGPGEAYGVRGVLESKNPQIDGRMIYVGRLAPRASASPRAVIRMRADSGSLGDAGVAVRLFDAHDTTTSVPFRFSGPVLNRH